jgi:hypothetical protein
MGGGHRRTCWAEEKRQRTYSITDTAQDLVTALGLEHNQNRSEVIEVLVRWAARENLDLREMRETLAGEISTATA